jgi:hypothetical protein
MSEPGVPNPADPPQEKAGENVGKPDQQGIVPVVNLQKPEPNPLDRLQPPVDPPPPGTVEPATHPEYYSDIDLVDDERIDFRRASGSPPPPAAYRDLRRQIEDVARLVRTLFQDDKVRLRKFLLQLHLTADSGLRGTNSNLDIGLDNLQDVKNNITDEFPAVRGKIWWSNFGLLLGVIVATMVASGIYRYFTQSWFPAASTTSVWPSLELALFLIPLGTAIGLFVEFIFRVNDDIPYEQLRAINPGRWRPFQRAFNTILVGYIFAGILGIGAFQVGVGSVLLNEFIDKKPMLSLVIGFVTGFAFPYVRDLVQQFRPVRRDSPG